MIRVENIDTYGLEAAIRGMRNPKNSWEKSDSEPCHYKGCGKFCDNCDDPYFAVGISSRILIEKFHWKDIPKDGVFDKRNKTARFADYLVDEINKITQDENADIRRYVEETYQLYGIKFIMEDVANDK